MITAPKPLGTPSGSASELRVAMRDGVRLATDVYLPPGKGPFPTVLMRTPYDKNDVDSMAEFFAPPVIERGYAFVAQDTRGRARSEGALAPFVCEALDGYDTLEWLSGQRWCNGRIAMTGPSYQGFTQWAAAASGHPDLLAITPTVASSNFGLGAIWRQGVFELGFATTWCASAWMDRFNYPYDLELPWASRPIGDVLPAVFEGRRSDALEMFVRTGESDPYWSDVAVRGKAPSFGTSVAALHHGGWWDLFQRGQIADWALASRTSPAPQPLVMGASDHVLSEWTLEPLGMIDIASLSTADLEAYGAAIMARPLDFLDAIVRDRVPLDQPPVTWELTHDGWHESEQWPPTGARPLSLYLTADGDAHGAAGAALAFDPDSAASWTRWVHDPGNLVPTAGPAHGTAMALMLPPDDSLVETREDVLVYTTEPLAGPLDLAGPIFAELQVGSSAPVMHVVVRLLDIFPDGTTRRIRDGAAEVRGAQADPHVVVDLGHTGYRVLPGHRLRLHIASSDFPRYLPYLGDDRDPWTSLGGTPNEQRIRIGGRHAGRIVLTTLPGDTGLAA